MSRSSEIRMAVIGAASWGTTVAAIATVDARTALRPRRSGLAEQIDRGHVDADDLGSFTLPEQPRGKSELGDR